MRDFTLEEFKDELDHLEFLDEMRLLVENIAWALASARTQPTKDAWDDIDVYGDEPIFTSLLMDSIESEYNVVS